MRLVHRPHRVRASFTLSLLLCSHGHFVVDPAKFFSKKKNKQTNKQKREGMGPRHRKSVVAWVRVEGQHFVFFSPPDAIFVHSGLSWGLLVELWPRSTAMDRPTCAFGVLLGSCVRAPTAYRPPVLASQCLGMSAWSTDKCSNKNASKRQRKTLTPCKREQTPIKNTTNRTRNRTSQSHARQCNTKRFEELRAWRVTRARTKTWAECSPRQLVMKQAECESKQSEVGSVSVSSLALGAETQSDGATVPQNF